MKKYLIILITLCLAVQVKAQVNKRDSIKRSNQIFYEADFMPSFPGGNTALAYFVKQTLDYPTRDREDNTQGRVYIRFVVEKDGTFSNIKIISAPSTTMGMEALRILNKMPKWIPGTINNKPVRVQYTLGIPFTL